LIAILLDISLSIASSARLELFGGRRRASSLVTEVVGVDSVGELVGMNADVEGAAARAAVASMNGLVVFIVDLRRLKDMGVIFWND